MEYKSNDIKLGPGHRHFKNGQDKRRQWNRRMRNKARLTNGVKVKTL